MKYLVFCVTLNLLFFANIVSSEVKIVANYDDVVTSTKKFDIKQALQISCNVTLTEEDLDAKVEVKWEKDGKSLPDKDSIKRRLSLSHNRNVYKLQLNAGEQEDAGNYSCIAYINNLEQKRAYITVESKIHVKIPRDITVIEGEKLRVVCLVHGNPIPQIVWLFRNETYDESRGRVKLEEDPEKKVPNAVFIIDEITVDDQQKELTCTGISKNTNESSNPSMGLIRVKDKYAALWPFLGICLEVLVLCAVILIYEKKRNKQELEESDTDQSPEQKNTPDHGGKETNLRHRQ